MIEGSIHEDIFKVRFDMALELTAVADIDLAEAIDILHDVDWDYDRAVSLLDGREWNEMPVTTVNQSTKTGEST